MKVSIITPTRDRQPYLDLLYERFVAQTYGEKELLILDDSDEPVKHPKWHADPRVKYVHSDCRMTIGHKRNRLLEAATGEIVVHFDDDDYYASRYVDVMVAALGGASLLTLSGWFVVDVRWRQLFYLAAQQSERLYYCIENEDEPRLVNRASTDDAGAVGHAQAWGYGFSYVYKRSVTERCGFDDTLSKGEDYAFARSIIQAGCLVRLVDDVHCQAVHVIHGRNTSRSFANHRLPWFLVGRLFGDEGLDHVMRIGSANG